MRLKQRHTIGAKLVTAFACSTLMLTIVCVVAWATWNQLDSQVNSLLTTSVPKYNLSYLLESRSSEIRRRVDLLASAPNKVELEIQSQAVIEEIGKVKSALSNNLHLQSELQEFDQVYDKLESYADRLAHQVSEKIDQQRSIDLYKEQLSWLHQDIDTELIPLRQEYHWQIERNSSVESTRQLLTTLNAIQQILDMESTLYAMVDELLSESQKELVNNSLKMVNFRLEELNSVSTAIFDHPAAIAYQQLISELTQVLKPEGDFHQLLLEKVALQTQLQQTNYEINRQLEFIHQRVARLIIETDKDFLTVKQETTQMVTYGNHVLIVFFSLSILISLFLTYYFINRRIVARLTNLSTSIDAIINDDLTHPIQVDGKDEIGRLSAKLIEYGDKVREIQRTNAISLINNTTASLVTCDTNGDIESANSNARRLLGLETISQSQKLWASFDSVNQVKLRQMFAMRDRLVHSENEALTLAIGSQEQRRYLHFDIRLFTHANLGKVIVTITDVTQQTNNALQLEQLVADKTRDLTVKNQQLLDEIAEREIAQVNLKNTQSELIQAAKMAVVGQTMTSLAHELNQPLSAMSTYVYSAEVFADRGEYDSVKQSISHIDGLVGRMGKIIKNLRHFARKSDGGELRQYSLHELVEQANILVSTKCKRQQIAISNTIPDDVTVWTNDVSLEQVLVNLMVNSCDAVVENGTEQKQVEVIYLEQVGRYQRFAITDTGSGFSQSIIDKLFQPFTTTKEVGLGLGLNICRSLIEGNGGHIYIASGLNQGAMVVMELPSEQV